MLFAEWLPFYSILNVLHMAGQPKLWTIPSMQSIINVTSY